MAILAALALLATAAPAADYTWGSATTGGIWSTTTAWDPTAPSSGPGSADTATLGNATANRTVTYDAAAPATLGTLDFDQSSAFLNELVVQRGFTLTSGLSLGGSGGTERLSLLPAVASSFTLTASGGITVNAGGELLLGAFNPSGGTTFGVGNLSGNVTVAGGLFDVAALVRQGTNTGNIATSLSGGLTMTSGTFRVSNPASSTILDRRLTVTGDISITAGSVATDREGSIIQASGATNTLQPASYDTRLLWSFFRDGDQSLDTSVALGKVTARGFGVKTLTSTAADGRVGVITFIDGSTTGTVGSVLRLGSDLSSLSLPAAETFSQSISGGRVDYGFDLQNFALDLSGAPTGWTPNTGAGTGTITNAVWTLTGNGGRVRAQFFNFGTAAVSTEIGPGVILEATGGNGTANTLSTGNSGTIDATAIFRYAGSAIVASPATLTSTRAVPTIEVTSGALQISSLTNAATAAASVSSGATLLVPNTIDDTAVGNLLGGTYAAGSAFGFNTAAGNRTYAGAITGGVGLTKTGNNTLTLSGANDYTGNTLISGGTLALNRPTGTTYAGVISGAGSLTLTNAGTLTLSGASSYQGATSLAGSLVLSGGNNRLPTTTTLNFTGASSTVDVGGNSQSLATFTTPDGLAASYTVTGNGGTLAVGSGAAVLQIGPGGAVASGNAVSMDLSGLGTFTYSNENAGSGLRVGLKSASSNSGSLGQVATLRLAAANTITTNAILVGDVSASSSGGTSTLRLGQANTLNTAVINVGNSGRSNANFEFAAGLTGATATIRGLDGTAALPQWLVGNVANFNAAGTWTANVNLSGGSVDALVTEMFVGNAVIGIQTGRAGTQNSTVTMGAGTLAVGTLTLGRIDGASTSSVSNTLAANGTLTIGTAGGQVVADSVVLARNTYAGAQDFPRTVSGTINLTAGTLAATSIARGPQTGNATATTAFNWTAGTLTHKAGTDLVVDTVPITLAAGTSTFEAAAGRTITLNSGSPLAGTGGFTKAGDGVLLLQSASTYSGTASIAAGTLRLAGGANRLPAASSVAFTAGGTTFDVGATSQTLAALVTPATGSTSVAVVGAGSLAVNGTQSFEVGPGGSGVTVTAGSAVDLSLAGLATFAYDSPTMTFRVGPKTGSPTNTGSPGISVLTLAAANAITAGTLGLADNALNDNAGGAELRLGTANTINVGTITQAFSRGDTTLGFAAGLTSPAATIRGVSGGTSAVATWTVGNVAQFSSAGKQSFSSSADFSAGSLDAIVGSLVVGQAATSDQTNRSGTQNSAFTMGAGTLAATTLTVGRITGGGGVGGTYAANGTLTIGTAGSLVEAGSLLLAENTLTATGDFARTVSGTVNLSAGTLRAGRIGLGDQTGGTATPSTTFTWTGGTIENATGGDLTVETLPLTLASGTGTFHATTSRTITVDAASPISGGGALVKTGSGTLVLAGANTFSGGTSVAAGRLAVNGSLAGNVTVSGGAELGGSGSIAGRISGAGRVAPGNSPGITTAADVDPTGGLGFGFEFTAPGDPAWANAAASVNDVLRLTAGTPFTASLTGANAVDVYFDVASFGGSAAFRGGFFTDAAADFLATIQAADYTYFVRGDGQGPFAYKGVNYYELSAWDPAYSVTVSTPTVALADFAGGGVTNGRVTEFVVVPEPGTTAGIALAAAVALAWQAMRRRGGAA